MNLCPGIGHGPLDSKLTIVTVVSNNLHTAILPIRKNGLSSARCTKGLAKHDRLPPVQFNPSRSESEFAKIFASVT